MNKIFTWTLVIIGFTILVFCCKTDKSLSSKKIKVEPKKEKATGNVSKSDTLPVTYLPPPPPPEKGHAEEVYEENNVFTSSPAPTVETKKEMKDDRNVSRHHIVRTIRNTVSSTAVVNQETTKDTITIGKLLYKIPDTMTVYTDYTITIRISRDSSIANISENISGKTVTSSIKTSSKMEVKIVDSSPDSSFLITKINSDDQLVDSDGYTQWVYTVRPIKHGDKKLDIVVSIIKGDNKKQIVYTSSVHIKDNIQSDISVFIKKYWQWIISTIIIPIIAYFWKNRKKDKKEKED